MGKDESNPHPRGLVQGWRETEWAKRWGWNLFGVSLGTGAVSVAISSIPYAFNGQTALTLIWLFMCIVFWIINLTLTAQRAIRYPSVFRQSFYDQTEAPWAGVSLMTLAPIMVVVIQLGIPNTGNWLVYTCEVLFYLYIAIAWVISWSLQSTLRRAPRVLNQITATDLYEILPFLLCGVVGSSLCSEVARISPSRGFTMLIFSLVLQGLAFWVSILKMAVWMVHHMTLCHAPASLLPTYMTAAAPAGFSALIFTNLAKAALTVFPANQAFLGLNMTAEGAAEGFAMAAIFFTLSLLGLYAWVVLSWLPWGLSHLAKNLAHRRVGNYAPTCWSWTFPTLGFISCFGTFAKIFPSKAFGILNIIGTIYLVIAWTMNMVGTINLLFFKLSPPGTTEEFDQDWYDQTLAGDWEPIRNHNKVRDELDSLRKRIDHITSEVESV